MFFGCLLYNGENLFLGEYPLVAESHVGLHLDEAYFRVAEIAFLGQLAHQVLAVLRWHDAVVLGVYD